MVTQNNPEMANLNSADMVTQHRVVVVEDHRILREGVRALLAMGTEFEVVGEAADGRAALSLIGKLQPALVLLDLSLPGFSGLEALREMNKRYPEARVLVLTVHKNEEYVLEALEAGARGYVLKDATREELISAMRYVMSGKTYLSPDIQEKVVSAYLSGGRDSKPVGRWDTLTHRERQILKLIAEGSTNKEIADYLSISAKTVAKHRANLMKKLDLHNASALTAFAVTQGLLDR